MIFSKNKGVRYPSGELVNKARLMLSVESSDETELKLLGDRLRGMVLHDVGQGKQFTVVGYSVSHSAEPDPRTLPIGTEYLGGDGIKRVATGNLR